MNEPSIPRTIHCCWFGGGALPRLARRCIATWQKMLPEYEIVLWTEENYDVNATEYSREAYQAGKFAFVSDYARFDIVAKHGGIYLDLDVEVVKSLEPFLHHTAFSGFEHGPGVNPGLIMGAVAGHPAVEELRNIYEHRQFVGRDGSLDVTTIVTLTTAYLQERGLMLEDEFQMVSDIAIYPTAYFCPANRFTGITEMTHDTHTIHHYAGSWRSPGDRMKAHLLRALGPAVSHRLVEAKQAIRRKTGQ